MSDNKFDMNNINDNDLEELLRLLDRLDKLEEVRRYRAAMQTEESIAEEEPEQVEAPEEPIRRDTARFQPTEHTAVDARDLLLTDWEDPLQMSEYLVGGHDAASLLEMDYDDEDDLPEAPKERRNPFKALWLGFCGNLPRREDATGTKVRKYGFLFSLLVMLVAAIYLVVDLLVIPAKNEKLKEELISLYHPEKAEIVVTPEEAEKNHYPENMLASFTDLYDRNNEVRGWISFHADGNKDFLNIEYPIVYSGDNSKYLKKDFDGNKSRNGTLFFDQKNQVNSYEDRNRALIVYGHNMASGQMFAGLNKMMGNVSNARAGATFTMSTLFRQDQYKVFAVVLIDESDKNSRSYNMWRTEFNGDADFLDHIAGIRARSMFDYTEVTVEADDQIVVLSTCTGKSSAHVKDGRLLVVARRVRDGEDPEVNTSSIKKRSYDPDSDDSVIMPYYWYINQNKPVHKYYTENGLDSNPVQKPTGIATGHMPTAPTTTTRPTQSTTTATGSGSESTDATGSDTTGSTDASGTTGTTAPSKPTQSTAGSSGATSAPTTSTTVTTGSSTSGSASSTTASTPTTTAPSQAECAHVYDNDCDKDCNNCGETRETDHKYESKVLADPTCNEWGKIQHTCQVCGNQYIEPFGEPTGNHTYDDEGNCTVCGAVKPADPAEPTEPTDPTEPTE